MPGYPEKLRVLIADSYPDAADSLAVLLTLWGHEPIIARTGPEALAAVEGDPPHVALVELRLDGLDGCEVARALRQKTGGRMTLVALTGLGDAVHRRRARECGCEVHLVKPVEPSRLQVLLGRLRTTLQEAGELSVW